MPRLSGNPVGDQHAHGPDPGHVGPHVVGKHGIAVPVGAVEIEVVPIFGKLRSRYPVLLVNLGEHGNELALDVARRSVRLRLAARSKNGPEINDFRPVL